MDYIDNILSQYGFGESVSLGGISKVKDAEPNHQAYAECYAYAMREEVSMENEKLLMHIEVAKIRATGEGLKDIANKVKDTVKEGTEKVKKALVTMYEKAIRFFTETVRYFFSNEKKLGKLEASIKASLKRTAKDDKKEIKIIDVNFNAGDSSSIDFQDALQVAYDKFEEEFSKKSFTDANEVADFASRYIEDFKSKEKEVAEERKNVLDKEKVTAENYTSAYNVLKKDLEDLYLQVGHLRNGFGNGIMKTLNKKIRGYQNDLKELKKSFKEAKDNSEEASNGYQIKRAILVNNIKATNMYKGAVDNSIGYLIQISNILLADFNKVSK
jgi:hypothetical protein